MGETLDAPPEGHLRMLLARAQNPFDVSDEVLERLSGAVLCRIDTPHAGRGDETGRAAATGAAAGAGEPDTETAPPAGLRCGRARHTFLLADGGVQTLWELWQVGAPHQEDPADDGPQGPRFEIYETEDALHRSERRVHGGGPVPGPRSAGTGDDRPSPLGTDALRPHSTGPESFDELDDPDPLDTLDLLDAPGSLGSPGDIEDLLLEEVTRSRPWWLEDSPGHARRLLRRAENPDRPGEETLRLLADARGHDIVHVPRPRACPPGLRLWCSLYEHAFLLADGTELRLYELEHNLTGGEGLVCEVYPDEADAERAARRYARARGIEL
ncbi:DUF6227 family protein [Streptomyces sp. RKND-216]|uniref:DUF6227 family protein n=1 Tax=Streptomyces sp. RKND-216 TaxID=2562581 RepID=UPI001B351322|nr:DUF6227 family protein [Streptomyces sp. RKND-216]